MDPAKMKVVDLRSELGALGLDTKGNKPALVERLKKALESKSGKALPDTSILDTSTEDADEPATPRRPGPASRTTRRSSSSRVAPATPAKDTAEEAEDSGTPRPAARTTRRRSSSSRLAAATPAKQSRTEPIEEEPKSEEAEQEASSPSPVEKEEPAPQPQPVAAPQPVPAPAPEEPEPTVEEPPAKEPPAAADVYSIEDEKSQSPVPVKEESMDEDREGENGAEEDTSKGPEEEKINNDKDLTPKKEGEEKNAEKGSNGDDGKEENNENTESQNKRDQDRARRQAEQEEWREFNERLKAREQERRERERQQAEEDAQRVRDLSKDPVKLQRLKRKQEKKARWSNFYRSVEVTNEVLTPPAESESQRAKKESTETKVAEPELNDEKITLSWYDSDLNQYLEVPELNSVVPLSEGAFGYAWAGTRASHGVDHGRVYYEVRIGDTVSPSEVLEKETIASGIRVGWSTDDSSLHLGEDALSWAYESSGRRVKGGEFEDYGAKLGEKDVVGVYLDLEASPCKISYAVNGVEQGPAFEFDKAELGDKALFPHVLTKNMCYKVNFGNDKYNMMTKTKTVRKKLEIPIEEVIEQKKAIEAELQKQKEEAERKEKERREKEKSEREERQRVRREEREKQERERKEREDKEKRDRGEEVAEDSCNEKEKEKEKEKPVEESEKAAEAPEEEQPKENGDKEKVEEDKPETETVEPEAPVKAEEPMETDQPETEVKQELTDEEIAEVTEEQILKGQVLLDKRIKTVIRYTVEEELDGPEVDLLPGYSFISQAELCAGPRRPASLADCEVILMVGLPGSGKTYWAKKHAAEHPERRYNIISTGTLFDRMKVDCKPFRSSYEGRWDAMVSKCAKCVQKLLEIAKGRRRNYIIDQTNVYPSAQRRKLRDFDGYRRVGVVIVTDEDTYKERRRRREEADGKEVPDGAVMDMKANFTLPEKSSWLDDVLYPELGADAARAVVDALHREARAAGVHRERRERSPASRGPDPKRSRLDRRHRPDRHQPRDGPRDREDRWGIGGGGGGGGRWGPPGRGGGNRWGSRDRSGPGPAGPPGRFDRGGWGGPPGGRGFNSGNDFGRDRDDFRGGRGGPPGRGGPGGNRGGPGGPRGDRGPGGPPGDRFGRPDRNQRPGGGLGGPDKRPNMPGGNQGGWQRGNQAQGNRNPPRPNQAMQRPGPPNQKDGQQNQGQNPNQQNPQWNQWANQWSGWGNWNQNQAGWGNWGNWGNWNQNAAGQSGQAGAGAGTGGNAAAKQSQQQWPANYTAQQWYQWQQWQQQQQGWQGYQQQQQQPGNQQAGSTPEQAWAQYYQNYGGGNANANNAATDKK